MRRESCNADSSSEPVAAGSERGGFGVRRVRASIDFLCLAACREVAGLLESGPFACRPFADSLLESVKDGAAKKLTTRANENPSHNPLFHRLVFECDGLC